MQSIYSQILPVIPDSPETLSKIAKAYAFGARTFANSLPIGLLFNAQTTKLALPRTDLWIAAPLDFSVLPIYDVNLHFMGIDSEIFHLTGRLISMNIFPRGYVPTGAGASSDSKILHHIPDFLDHCSKAGLEKISNIKIIL